MLKSGIINEVTIMTSNKKVLIAIGAIALVCVVGLIAIAALVFQGGTKVKMDGPSMEPTFSDGDILIIDSDYSELERGDVVVYEREAVLYIKRIVGLPGETIELSGGDVYVDGQLLEESYLKTQDSTTAPELTEFSIGENEFFVLGDNRTVSLDSRMERHGMVLRDKIVGIVKL